MTHMVKRAAKVIGLLTICYAIAPVFAGLFNTSDPRGPIIYLATYHDIAHAIGESMAGRPRSKTPFAERPLFYGMEGKPIDREQRVEELRSARASKLPQSK